jgi:hypothetical protein
MYNQGRAERRDVLNFVLLMSKAQKAANSVKERNYQQEVGAALRGNAGEQSLHWRIQKEKTGSR